MQLYTLGKLRLEHSDFHNHKPLLLLSYLALEGAKPRRYLAELFWTKASNPMNSLRKALSQLRSVDEALFESDEHMVSTNIVSDAQSLIEALEQSHYEDALNQYSAPFLEGIHIRGCGEELEEWIYATRDYLAERIQNATLVLAEQRIQAGDVNKACEHAEHAYKTLPEADAEVLKRLYPVLHLGNSPVAKQVRQNAESYGFDLPMPELAAITVQDPNLKPPKVRDNLPTRGTSFIGRDLDMTELSAMLADEQRRLITVLGMGGVGKTRFALEVAAKQLEQPHFPDGIYFVALDALSDIDSIPTKIAEAMGLELKGKNSALEQLSDRLEDKTLLLLLDNFEHLLNARDMVTHLLESCPNLKLLITSREALQLEEEWRFELSGLLFPEEASEQVLNYDAVQLFLERASRVRRVFERSEENLASITQLCQRLQGVPLALEMAASWLRAMSLAEIVKELNSSLDLLSSTNQNVPTRQQSIKATFEYSWTLLTEQQQTALAKLSVFRGGFTREAAQQVADLSIPLLITLQDKSLLQRSSESRYDLHPLIRDFCQGNLRQSGEAESTLKRHSTFFLSFAEKATDYLHGYQQTQWLEQLEKEHENFIAVIQRALRQNKAELGLHLVNNISTFWLVRGYYQLGTEWIIKLVDQCSDQSSKLFANTMQLYGALKMSLGNFTEAEESFTTSLSIYQQLDDKQGHADTLHNLGIIAEHRKNLDKATMLYNISLAINRKLKDHYSTACSLNNLGVIHDEKGNYVAAKELYEESLKLRKDIGDYRGIANTLNNLGANAEYQGDYEEAKKRYETCLCLFKELNDNDGVALTLHNLAFIADVHHNFESASLLYADSLKLFHSIGAQNSLALVFANIARLLFHRNIYDSSVKLFAYSEELYKKMGVVIDRHAKNNVQHDLYDLQSTLQKETFNILWAMGKRLLLNNAINLALKELEHLSTTHQTANSTT